MTRRRLTWSMGLCVSLLAVLVFHLMFFNRFAPVQEGWFSAYAHEILAGKMPYRDFYLFLQPVYPLLAAALIRLFGYHFLVFHIYGLVERLVCTALLYALLARVSRPPVAALAAIASIVIFAASPVDVLYSYLQTCLVLSLAAAWLLLRVIDREASCRVTAALVAGVVLGLAFFTKQSLGFVVLGATSATTAFVLIRGHDPQGRRLLFALAAGVVLPAAAVFAWLGIAGAISPYFDQVYSGAAASKGSLGTMLSGFVGRALDPVFVRPLALFYATVVVWWVLARRYGGDTDGRSRRASRREALLVMVAAAIPVWWYLVAEKYRWWVAAIVAVAAGYALLTELVVRLRTPADGGRMLGQGDVSLTLFAGAAAITAVLIPISSVVRFRMLIDAVSIPFLRMSLAELVLSLILVVGGFQLRRVWRRPRDGRATTLLLFAALGIAVMGANGLSFVIDETALIPALGVVTVVGLQCRPWGKRFKDGLVVGALVVMLFFSAAQKYGYPYIWWGWREAQIGLATQQSPVPDLRGFRLNMLTNDVYTSINDLIDDNLSSSEWLFTFPNIPFFYVTSGHYPRTFALVHYWDVCPDDVARRDARVLLSDPPGVIVELVMPEKVWVSHEITFRSGARSGQRDIAAAIQTLVARRGYRLLGEFPTRTFCVLRVWAAPTRAQVRGLLLVRSQGRARLTGRRI